MELYELNLRSAAEGVRSKKFSVRELIEGGVFNGFAIAQ